MNGKKPARDTARLGDGVVYKSADPFRFRGFGKMLFLELVCQDVHPIGDARQLLAHPVVKVVADALLFAIANLQNLSFQAFALRDIARDTFNLYGLSLLFHDPRADFELQATPRPVSKIPFCRGQGHIRTLDDLFEPALSRVTLFLGDKFKQFSSGNFIAAPVQKLFSGIVE